ncbi:hypothetical protein HID58_026465 [Brassica napus]|uniref:Uncharacterized protein n=1 Tax=Brassica napus TaxID=3708 RepID=A0ABQ8CQZ2_BRANA|nr:hypothetical protein HID58_026465 [Brassica napus]
MCDYNVGQIGLQVHGGAPGMSIPYLLTLLSLPVMFWYLRFIGFVSAARGKSHHIHDPMKEAQRLFMSWLLPTLKSEPTKAVEPVRGPNTSHGHEALPHHAGPLVNIERDRGLEEMTAARVLVGSRIIVQSHFSHRKNWWRNWSSTALARRKGTCDDVQLGSWKREGIQSRRMKSYLLLKRKSLLVARFVEAANAFLRRSKAKRSVMSSDTVFSFFYREVVDAQKEVSRQGKD